MKVAFICVLIFVTLLFGCVGGCQHYQTRIVGNGTKVGTVIKLAQEGFLQSCKTWEGELIRGGMNNGSGAFSTKPLYFTVNDPGLLREVQAALDGQYEVEVTYIQFYGPMFCASENEGNYFLTSIKKR